MQFDWTELDNTVKAVEKLQKTSSTREKTAILKEWNSIIGQI